MLHEYRFDREVDQKTTTLDNIKALMKYNLLKLRRFDLEHESVKDLLNLDQNLFTNEYRILLTLDAIRGIEGLINNYLDKYSEFELTKIMLSNNLPFEFLKDFIFTSKYSIIFKTAPVIICDSIRYNHQD